MLALIFCHFIHFPMKRIYTRFFLTGFLCACLFSCAKEKIIADPTCEDVKASYTKDIRSIITSNCMGSSCHNNPNIGDYSTYEGLKVKVDAGTFKKLVLDTRVMPPTSRPALSEHDLDLIRCWLNDDAPEN